jgi:hypothetical protein
MLMVRIRPAILPTRLDDLLDVEEGESDEIWMKNELMLSSIDTRR